MAEQALSFTCRLPTIRACAGFGPPKILSAIYAILFYGGLVTSQTRALMEEVAYAFLAVGGVGTVDTAAVIAGEIEAVLLGGTF